MKYNHLFWGVFLVVLGGLILLNNYAAFSFEFDSIIKFWPLILILIGLRMIIKNNLINSVTVILSGILLAIIVYSLVFVNFTCGHMRFFRDSYEEKRETISQNFSPMIKRSYLDIDYSFGDFKINPNREKLIDGEIIFTKGKYYFDGEISDSVAEYKLISKDNDHMKFFSSKKFNNLKLSIHPIPEWNINFINNFVDCEFDLQQINIRSLKIEGNFSKGNILLNPASNDCKIDLDFNFSNYKIKIPDSVLVDVFTNDNLSSIHLNGFTKLEKNHFQTKNLNGKKPKIQINLSSNFSKIVIEQ